MIEVKYGSGKKVNTGQTKKDATVVRGQTVGSDGQPIIGMVYVLVADLKTGCVNAAYIKWAGENNIACVCVPSCKVDNAGGGGGGGSFGTG